jgi:hemerythrin-like metal-binding protein
MPFYVWDPKVLSVSVDEMDIEHQLLIQKMNAVYDGVNEKKPLAELSQRVDDFVSYTVKHFNDEEAYQAKIGFDGLPGHKLVHKQLLTQVTKFVEEFKKTGAFPSEFFQFLSTWLTNHILGVDTRYGAWKK